VLKSEEARAETSTQIDKLQNQLKPKVTNMNIDNFPEIDFESLPLCEEAPQA
jgi:hypothetical protein